MLWPNNQGVTRPAAVPSGMRVYAVGDIHGRADLLDAMAGLVERDLATDPGAEALTIFLGDYVDRGPSSAAVIDRLAHRDFPTPILTLCGNHEDILLDLLSGELDDIGYYAQVGGDATLASYGLDWHYLARTRGQEARLALLEDTIPARHRDFLQGLALSEEVGDYFFCHAGVRPGVPLHRQDPHDLMWIRHEFLEHGADVGKVVIHGHTPVKRPLIRRNGIDIDTHAFRSGVLTAIVLAGSEQTYLQAVGETGR